ncbi:hypothetical protein CR513_03808, partial [Mucuna pruriens]
MCNQLFFYARNHTASDLACSHWHALLEWLANQVHVSTLNVHTFAKVLRSSIENNSKLIITYAHLLYHSFSKGLCRLWTTNKSRKGFLVPANRSKWANLIGSNLWRNENYIELGKEYLNPSCYTDYKKLIKFLTDTQLTKDSAFLLLDWFHKLKNREVHLPKRFLKCIKEGRWLKVTIN